ncbi:unnamed protein product [Prunus armeniaca]
MQLNREVAGEILVGQLCTKHRYKQTSKGNKNEETGQPLAQSNRVGGGEILVGELCTEHRYTQISNGNWEKGNWLTTCAVKSSKWLGKSLSDNCVLIIGTLKYLKATGNGEIGQPPMPSNRAGGYGNHCRTRVLSIGTCRYLMARGNGEIGQRSVQSNRAGGEEILVEQLCVEHVSCKLLKATRMGKFANHLCNQIR